MDLLQIIFTLFSIFIIVFLFVSRSQPKRNKCTAPMAKGAWPIIGHFEVIAGREPPHRLLGSMADEYGPVFLTRFGSFPLLVVSCHKTAKEIFTVHDKMMDRQPLLASTIIGYDNAMLSFSPYGPNWREMRKILAVELVSNQRLDSLARVRKSEVDLTVREMYSVWEKQGRPEIGVLFEMNQKVKDLTGNISLMTIAGKRYFGDDYDGEEARKVRKLRAELRVYFGLNTISDLIPPLGFLDFKLKRDMKRTAKELDVILEGWIREHKQKKKASAENGEEEEAQDFIDVLLNVLETSKFDSALTSHTVLKALCTNFILVGSDTTMTTVVWTIALLANNPEKLKKVQEELDMKIGKTRILQETDITDLVYLQAVVKETTRLYPSVPLNAFRTVMEDFTISQGNYYVPAGSLLILNAWKIHHDPSIWQEPSRFEPERFLTTHKDISDGSKGFKLVNFGLRKTSLSCIQFW